MSLVTPIGIVSIGDIITIDNSNEELRVVDIDMSNLTVTAFLVDGTGGYNRYILIEQIKSITPKKNKDIEELEKPKRYNKTGKLECWDVIIDQNMNFLEGSVLKYLWRYKEKNGIHDLKKAIVYINKIISELEKNEKFNKM